MEEYRITYVNAFFKRKFWERCHGLLLNDYQIHYEDLLKIRGQPTLGLKWLHLIAGFQNTRWWHFQNPVKHLRWRFSDNIYD